MGRPRIGCDARLETKVSYPVAGAAAALSASSGISQRGILRNAIVAYLEPLGLLLDDEPRHVNDSNNRKEATR
ncbi:hypothetical protein ACAD29_01584 [Clavibacter nebraskensis]